MKDPTVEEVRLIRIMTEQECVKSGMSYTDHLLSVQKEFENRLVIGYAYAPEQQCARNSGNI